MSRYSDREVTGALEILKDRFYFITVRAPSAPRSDAFSHYFTVEDDLTYEPFFADFGPLNLGHVYTYCHFLDEKLKDDKHARKKIYHYSSNDGAKRTNAVFLIGCYCVLVLGHSPDEVYHTFMNVQPPLMLFRDASMGPSSFGLSVLDSWRGLIKAQSCGFFSLETFDVNEYYFYERVENGDMNWILPGKFLAFSGPHSSHHNEAGLRTLTPEDYIPYFRKHHVNHVVRLNKKAYDKRRFTDYGVGHTDLYFIDGSTPSDAIVQKFISLVENESGAVAVHCKAGLGRTGTLIACYIMKHYKFTAQEMIGWLRICRPGSVIGPQQHFLISMQASLWKDGDNHKRKSLQQSGRSEVSIETSRSSKLSSSGKSIRSESPSQRSTTSLSSVSVGVRSETTSAPKTPTSNRRSGDFSVYNNSNSSNSNSSNSNNSNASSSPFSSTKDKLKADMRIITATLKSMRTTSPATPSSDGAPSNQASVYNNNDNNNNNTNYEYSSPIPPPTLYSTSPYATPSRLSNLFTKSKLPSGLSLQQRKLENQRHRQAGGATTSAPTSAAPVQKSSPPPKSIMSVARSTSPTTASRAYGQPTPAYTPTKTSPSTFTPGHRKTRSTDASSSAQYSTPTYNNNNNNNNNNNVLYIYSPSSPSASSRTPDYATSASSVNTTSPTYYSQRSKTPPNRRTSGEFDTRTLSAYSSYSSSNNTNSSMSDVYKQRRLSAPRYLRT